MLQLEEVLEDPCLQVAYGELVRVGDQAVPGAFFVGEGDRFVERG